MPELAGQPAVFKCLIHEIKAVELPDVDDEFVKDVSEFETVDEYKADIKAKLTERAEKAADAEVENAVFDAVVPEYVSGIFYGALCQSYASEQAARRTAMDSASKNADDMIEDLSLKYNRARQGAITQEITEIVAGAEH